MKEFNKFYFEGFSFDNENLIAKFNYSFDKELFFEEKIDFSSKDFLLRKDLDLEIINNILFHIHIALGISYYKFFPTKDLVLETGVLDDFQTDFWKKFYINGLGEFFYKNNLNPNLFVNFIYENKKFFQKKEFEVSQKYLVPVGGGKDSIVSIELLKKMGKNMDLVTFAVNDNILYENTAKNSGLKRLFIKREMPKNILEVISLGYYNGHVPITGMIAFVLELASYLYDYKYIILSNELSANFGNTIFFGVSINHQWSKSLDFEKDFGEYVEKYISKKVKYFSILRPFYELRIAEVFSKVAKKYFNSFSSCNTNFKIFNKKENKINNNYWCNSCPKCAFVYSILRPFLTKEETLEIFKKELYEDKSLEKLFRELLGISGIKPFECVGTNEEVILSMKMILDKWKGKLPYILEIFKNEVYNKMTKSDFEKLKQKILTADFESNMVEKELLEKLEKLDFLV
ncbi:MAG: hypothetical protein PHE25_06510 [Candidatus Gracilibacteria bacterium]|nr:hypothetical protein [Candidatus Gracilibacteria bacterium]